MAVSYVSKPYKSDPYVLPFDLNLFSKVMQYQEAKFDSNAHKIQGEIDQMGSMDVLKSEDRNYVNGKINTLVNGLNNLGGVNLADDNIVNQIEGAGSDIYSDNKVLTAIAGTKAVRSLTAGYDAMKTNPKLAKMYSPVNEAYDMRAVQSWLGDGQVGSTYHGPTSASPYTPYRDNHIKAFNQIKANLREKVTDKGLIYVTENNEEVTPERVMQMATDLLTPDERIQMKKDSWYLYKDVAPQQVVQKALDFNNQKIQRATDIYNNYKANAEAATADPIAKQNYLNLAQRQQNEINTLTQASQQISKTGMNKYKENPEEFMYNVYSNEYFRGLSERFAYSKNTTKVTANQAEMFRERQNQLHEQFEENLNFQKEKFSNEYELNLLKAGAKFFKDPFTGILKFVGAGFGLTTTNVNTADTNQYKANEQVYKNENANLEGQKQQLFTDFIAGIARKDPNLSKLISSAQTGTGILNQIKGVKGLERVNQKPGLQIDDLNIDLKDPKTKNWQKINGVTDEQAAFLKSLYDNYEAMSKGEKVDINKLPAGFDQLVENYQLINEKINANNAKMQSVNQTAYAQAGISDADMDFYNKYIGAKSQMSDLANSYEGPHKIFGKYVTTQEQTLDDFLTANKARFNQIYKNAETADKIKKDLYQQVENRPVFEQELFSSADQRVKSGDIQRLFVSNLARTGDVEGRKATIDVKDVEPIQMGKSADGTDSYDLVANVVTGSGEKKSTTQVTVKLSGEQALQLGFRNDPYKELNESVTLMGRSGNLLIRGGKDLVAKINVVKANNDRTDETSYIQLLVPTNDPNQPFQYIDIKGTDGQTPSEAYAKIKELIKNYAKLGGTLQQFQQDILQEHYSK